MIATKVALECDIVLLDLRWESSISGVGSLFLTCSCLTTIVLHVSDVAIKLTFEHSDAFNRIAGNIISEFPIEHA